MCFVGHKESLWPDMCGLDCFFLRAASSCGSLCCAMGGPWLQSVRSRKPLIRGLFLGLDLCVENGLQNKGPLQSAGMNMRVHGL